MDSSLHAGLSWLMKSGIQHPTGAVFGEYSSLTASYNKVSTEAAAVSIQSVLGLGEPPDDERRDAAVSAGRYLMERSFDLHSDLFLDDPTVDDRRASFSGCAAALRAMNALGRATGDTAYSECADRCGRSIQVRMTRVDGSFFPEFEAASQRAMGDDAGPDQLKAAAAFLELADDGGMPELRTSAENLLNFALQRHEGFVNAPHGGSRSAAQEAAPVRPVLGRAAAVRRRADGGRRGAAVWDHPARSRSKRNAPR